MRDTEHFSDFIARKKAQEGERFSVEGLSKKFIPFFETQQRIKVKTCGMILTGTIGVTTGWKPAFLLMRTTRSIGSPWILSDKDEILGIKRGRTYSLP